MPHTGPMKASTRADVMTLKCSATASSRWLILTLTKKSGLTLLGLVSPKQSKMFSSTTQRCHSVERRKFIQDKSRSSFSFSLLMNSNSISSQIMNFYRSFSVLFSQESKPKRKGKRRKSYKGKKKKSRDS